MSTKYKATTTEDAYFITITTVGWVDVFTRLNQIDYYFSSARNYAALENELEMVLLNLF